MRKKKKMYAVDAEGNVSQKEIPDKRSSEGGTKWQGLEYSSIGFYLTIPFVLGIGGGIAFDRWFGTSQGVLIGILLGAVASFYNLWKLVKESK